VRYLGHHPIAKLDRQRSQMRRRVHAAKQRAAKKPGVREILAAAVAGRELRAGTGPGPTIDFGDCVAPELPTEHELLLRIFPPRASRKPSRRQRIRLKQIERARALSGWKQPDQHEQNPDLKVGHNDTSHERLPMATQARDTTYDLLPGPAAALYRQLGACPVEWIDAHGLAVVTDLDEVAAPQLAAILVDANLLDTVEHGWALSTDGHLHARIKAEESEFDELTLTGEGLDRLFAFLRDAARAAEQLITPSHRPLWPNQINPGQTSTPPFELEDAAALDWLERQLPNYMAVLRFASLDRRSALVCDLSHSLWPLWLRRRHPEQRYEAHLLGLAAATILVDDHAIGQMLTNLAGSVRGTRPVEAYEYNRRAAAHYQETGDSMGLAQALNGLGKSLLDAGHLDQADQLFRDAEVLRIDLDYVRGAGLSRQGRGLVALARHDPAAAADHLLAAHQTLSDCEDAYDGALTLAYHAEAVAGRGDLDGALSELDTAASALGRASSVYGQAVVWEIRARILAEAGRGQKADAARALALALYEQADPDTARRLASAR
jgi:tetratricopeptide (TPR) repeat protein